MEKVRLAWSLPIIASLLVLSTGCSSSGNVEAAESAAPPPLVTVAPAIARDVPIYLDEIGRNSAYESVTVAPQVGGRILERHFQDGADVKAGQLLFVIDPRPYQAQLDSARANLAQQKAALELAGIQFARDQLVIKSRAISQQDYDTRKNNVEVSKALVEAAKAAVENAQLNLDYCYIHSPISGRAGRRLVDVGNIVQPNTTALLLVQRLDPMYADFTITERDLPRVQERMVSGRLKASVRLPSDSEDRARTGQLTFLDNTVQNNTGTVNLRVTMSNADHRFWPGQFVNVRLVLETQENAVLVPSQATLTSQKGPFAYVIKPDDTVELRLITLGQRHGDQVVVSQGIAAGERVVTVGQMTLQPGAKVRIASPGSTPASAMGNREAGDS